MQSKNLLWAKSSIGDQPRGTIEAIQKGLTVSLIATKRADFVTCELDEIVSSVADRNRHTGFDFLPVVEPLRGNIVGLIEISTFLSGRVTDPVGKMMRPLSEDNLLGADASILTFLRDADHKRFRLIVSGHEVSGLVSLSDLQQLPVRAALFGLVTYLEIIMSTVIRDEFNDTDKWMNRLSARRQQKIHEEITKARVQEPVLEPLHFTLFADKATIIRQGKFFLAAKDVFEHDFKKIQSLRNHLAHANDYAASPDAAVETCQTVRLIDSWSERLMGVLPNDPPAARIDVQ